MSKHIVTFGEIMLRLATPGNQRFVQSTAFNASYGGGEANVAVSLANYGLNTEFVTRLPENDLGRAAEMEMRKHNVGTQFIQKGGNRLGVYFLETGAVNRPSKVIYDRADSSIATIEKGTFNWKEILKNASWFHWTGITPAISEGAAGCCLEAVKTANDMGITVSCDLNYRKNLWKWGKQPAEVMEELVKGCDIILGNEEDADKVFGIKPEGVDISKGNVSAEAYKSVCEQIIKRFTRAKKVIITLRGSINANHNTWSGVIFNGKTLYQGAEYNITHIVDRVGGGDSFMGGLIYGLQKYINDDQKALNFAVATSCLKHTIPGDLNLVSVSEVENLMQGNASGRVSR